MAVANVYLNGTFLGQHKGGYTSFIYDARAARVDSDNVLAVEVNNDSNSGLPASQNGWMHFGGIHRKAWTLTTAKYVIDPTNFASPGVYISQKNVSAASAQVSIKTMLRNYDAAAQSFAVNNIVCDSSGTIVTALTDTVTVTANARDPSLRPALYRTPHCGAWAALDSIRSSRNYGSTAPWRTWFRSASDFAITLLPTAPSP